MPEFSDILLIIIAIFSALIFNFLGTEKLYRFYFGIIMWFLLFLVFNLQVQLFEISWEIDNGWKNFLVWNKDFVLWFFSLMIPIFWALFAFINSDIKSNKLFSLLFWFFLPLFLVWIFGYILMNSAVSLDFLKSIFWFFNNSSIFNFLQKTPVLIFWLLLLIIFWRYLFAIIIAFILYVSKLLVAEIKDLNWENKQIEKGNKKIVE
jgi:hypothetical protein